MNEGDTMANKVNNFTIFLNYFTPIGRLANKEIKNMRSGLSPNAVYQKRLSSDTIILQHDKTWKKSIQSTTVLLGSDGSKNVTLREKKFFENGFELLSIIKKSFCGMKKNSEKQVLYNTKTGKIEEKATKIYSLDGPSILTVKSTGNRESHFPVTKLAGPIHPAVAKKEILKNGDTIYIESYPHS